MVTFLFVFILDLHAAKILTMPYCAAFGCKHHSVRYRVAFFKFPGKTDSSEAMDSQLQAGWLEAHVIG